MLGNEICLKRGAQWTDAQLKKDFGGLKISVLESSKQEVDKFLKNFKD
jgi:hypothetical protein